MDVSAGQDKTVVSHRRRQDKRMVRDPCTGCRPGWPASPIMSPYKRMV